MPRIFTGDYSTGDWSQWNIIGNKDYSDEGAADHRFYYPARGKYPAQVLVNDPDAGYCARFEVRDGDIPPFGGSDRSEVIGGLGDVSVLGSTRWYAFSVKFDATWPINHHTLGWGIVTQFHDYPNKLASPVISFGWTLAGLSASYKSNKWYLMQNPQVAPNDANGNPVALAELPLSPGEWQDIKLEIKWAQDTTGFVRLWHNGERQTLLTGGETFTGQTVVPAGGPGEEVTGICIQQGYYRESTITSTGVVYHTGMRSGDSEASL